MKKIALISIIFILFISLSFVSADDSMENETLTTTSEDVSLSQEIIPNDTISVEEDICELSEVNEISVDDSNYYDYFSSSTGKFKSDVDASKINTLKIGNVSDKLFLIDRPLSIMPMSSDCEMKNSVIHLIAGSDGSTITGLTINNTKGEIFGDVFLSKLHGIWFTNSSYNYVYNNTIRIAEEEGCYAMPMGWSSYNRIINNDMRTAFTCCMVMGSCHNNNISDNKMEILRAKDFVTSNCIYFNDYGHADYSGPANCSANYISNNYFKLNSNSDWSIGLVVHGGNKNKIINNTVIRGSYGIQAGDGAIVDGNTIINSTTSITTGGNTIVSNNKIIGFSQRVGIYVGDVGNVSVHDNLIDYAYLELCAIRVVNGIRVFNNTIKTSTYGIGISVQGKNNSIIENTLDTMANGIIVQGSNNLISNNFISTAFDAVESSTKSSSSKIYNNTISFNRIRSEGYAIVLNGYVYNTQVHDNLIECSNDEAFYIDIIETFNDKDIGMIMNNNVNGVIEGTDTIIVDDDNFYDYFDEEGYFIHEFNFTENRMLFLSFLTNKNLHFTDQIVLTSNRQPNLLYNVTITFSGDACDSSISDFKFYNIDKTSIILDGVENVDVKNNEFTSVVPNVFDASVISVIGGCLDLNIVDNDISIISNSNYTYAILVSEPNSKIRKQFSSGLNISNNNIFIKSAGVSEGIYADALIDSVISSNDINIISDDSAYGIAITNVFERPHNIKIDSNEITVYSKDMSYLIELYMSDSIEIVNNYLKGISNGIYGVGVYSSQDIEINKNEIVVVGLNLTEGRVFDALGKGNSAIYVNRFSKVNSIFENIIDVDDCEILTNDSSSLINDFKVNYYVISPYNYDYYFNFENKLFNGTINDYDVILFKNFTTFKTMNIDFPVLIKPYKHLNQFTSYLILSGNYSNLTVSGFDFKNATLELNNISNVNVTDNSFVSSKIHDICGVNNSILNNSFIFNLGEIIFDNTINATFAFNKLSGNVSDINIITSNSAIYNNISFNLIVINSTGDVHVYNSLNTSFDSFLNNEINVIGDCTQSIVYYGVLSSNNIVRFNKIISNSIGGNDYAVIVNSTGNIISNNYLISSNGFRRGNDAVNGSGNVVRENTPADLYVSASANVGGNGSWESPFATIHEALENASSGSTIYILPGCYNESNFVIDKNITLTAINQEGNTYINALNNRLFEITKSGALTINALKIFNGFSTNGGGLFYNKGSLVINNSMLYNSSSYYDNSNPVFTKDKYNKDVFNSYNSKNLGLGGAILNYGNLVIDSSNLFDNFAHKGGALADFGRTTVKNSLFYNNAAVHGGAIYTDSKQEFNIDNSFFHDNLAVTTLDYCYIKKYLYSESGGIKYYYYKTYCDEDCGSGGAIFSNSPLVIDNSLFEANIAKSGGAIATDSNIQNFYQGNQINYIYYSDGINFKFADTTLSINNTVFRGNVAQNTVCGNETMLKRGKNDDYYYMQFNGGAIFGSLKKLYVYDSLFEDNVAKCHGGALLVQCEDSSFDGCRFYNNTAGLDGGALEAFGNYNIVNTELVGNYAQRGGAVRYSTYYNFNHIRHNMVMFNVTVANNTALYKGGAFYLEDTNFAVRNSNIYGNTAAYDDTLYEYHDSLIDARGNWWGTVDGPDDSIRSASHIQYITWASDKVNWGPVSISSPDDDTSGSGGKNNGGNSYSRPVDSKTGTGARTGSTLTPGSEGHGNSNGFNFGGKWPYSGNGNGNSGGFNGNGLRFAGNTSGNSKTSIKGNNVNPNSMSKINSSSVNDLPSVGMSANAADSSISSQSSSSGDGGSAGSSKAYEIKKEVKKEIIDDHLSIFNLLFILLWIFLFIGFYRKYKSDER